MSMRYDPKHMTKEQLQKVADKMYPGMALFARDVNLPETLTRRYTPGLIIREKAFTDASSRFMGMVTTHRYVILSNHMADLSQFEQGTHWGLHVAQKGSHFKVLGQHTHQGKTGIFLLHLPDDENWRLWQTAEFSMDRQLYEMAVQRFTQKCVQPPALELTQTAWLDRCAFPVGMSDDGAFWPLEDDCQAEAAVLSPKAESPTPPPAASDPREVKRGRFLGCLLGGAVGDALGYPVEFLCEDTIREKYGAAGIQTLAQAGRPALISDDTQMTLFAANAIVYTSRQGGSLRENLWKAYREWLGTQGDTSRMDDPDHPSMWVYREPRMHARRAPGNSCLSAIRYSPHGGAMAKPVNNSKGCGTVMRAAPFGLASRTYDGAEEMAAADAALTHGHPLAWSSSELLAKLISWVVHEHPDRGTYRLEDVIPHLGKGRDPAAYALGRFNFKGKKIFLLSFLLSNAFPKMGLYISIGVIFYRLNLMGTLPGVVLIHVLNSLMFMTWIPANAFRSIHSQQEESARDAGAGPVRTFFSITLPMAMPGIIVASVFTFLGSLEESQGTLLVGFPQIKTMPVELYGVIMQYPITAGPVLSLLLIIPTIVILVALRKYVGPEAIAKGYNMK